MKMGIYINMLTIDHCCIEGWQRNAKNDRSQEHPKVYFPTLSYGPRQLGSRDQADLPNLHGPHGNVVKLPIPFDFATNA